MTATAVILAAGLGTRMRSSMPKALHRIAGRPMLQYLLASCEAVFEKVVVVVGPDMAAVQQAAAPHRCVIQAERLGTAHAALQAAPWFGDGDVAILYADNPLVRPETLRRLLDWRALGDAGLVLLAMRPADPARYGRVIGDGHYVERIVEWADASPAERNEGLCNAGVLCASAGDMARWLAAVRADNAKREYYLTDTVALARAERARVAVIEAPEAELGGINSRAELALAEAIVQDRLRTAAMDAGVTMTDPSSVFLCADTRLAQDVTLAPNVVFGPGVSVGRGTEIRAFSYLEGCAIGEDCQVGPFTRIRPGTVLEREAHVGNFVELKATALGAGAKANHLTYLGDTEVGARANIGAGTITCNYDGFAKHRTTIGAGAFIGSDTALVAPVRVGDGAITAAGSVITEDVAADAMAIARGRQVSKPGRAASFRQQQQAKRR
ncbi:MAG TPA: bifunctional UDP-N-acetylglucosamine diphosphorylase/glucosamine-1-phosphate N-acetyltransferase GlmU [Acetobacteraceae bacterium]|nr:bifunctional UDP-N-acetylglucosamine diphosphorylase/glucosamine-1-phosphate N-acetyltransferase GlmU [Acetobacteraceae bacterium]